MGKEITIEMYSTEEVLVAYKIGRITLEEATYLIKKLFKVK